MKTPASLRFAGIATLLALGCASTSSEGGDPPSPRPAGGGLPAAPSSGVAEASFPRSVSPILSQGDQEAEARRLLDQEAERVRLRRERASVLAAQYLARGKEAFERADFPGALAQFAEALEADPSSQEARDWVRKTEAVLGERGASAAEIFREASERETVRRAEALLAAEQAVLDGDNASRAGRYEDAIARYREALVILRFHPLLATEGLSEKGVRDRMDRALSARDAAESARAAEIERRAKEEQARREREEREAREKRVAALFREANVSFVNERYRRAEELLDQILATEPENAEARELKEVVVAARHESTDRELRQRMREEWQRTFVELESAVVPQTDTVRFDLERWAEVSRREPRQLKPTAGAEGAEEREIRRKLEETVFPAKFDEAGIAEVASFFQNLTGVNFLLSRKVREEVSDEEKTIRGIDLKSSSVRKVLDLVAELTPLGWRIRNGVVQIVHKDELKGGQIVAHFEVRDIVHPVRDFPAPEINLTPSGGAAPAAEELPAREYLVINSDKLVELIRANIAPESWAADERNTISYQNGTLVVRQTPAVLEKIARLLDDLRESTGILVDIQSRFLKVEDSFLEDIGIDWRGLGDDSGGVGLPGLGTSAIFDDFGTLPGSAANPGEIGSGGDVGAFYSLGNDGDLRARAEQLYDLGLGNANILTGSGGLSVQYTLLDDVQLELILRAVSKSERIEEVTAPRLLVFNTERANLRVLNQVTYVKDFDVEIAQAAAIADPIIDVAHDGVFLDVRPVVSADRKFITMELRPTVAVLKRPIPERSTSLGVGSPVTIQLPELEIQRARTTVSIPDGGTIVLGGLKVTEQQDFRSGVPILNKIPILSALFERKGKFVSNRKLLILIRAKIVIPKEHEPVVHGAPR